MGRKQGFDKMDFGFLGGYLPGETENVRKRCKNWLARLIMAFAVGEFRRWLGEQRRSLLIRLATRLRGEITEDQFSKDQLQDIRNTVREQLSSPGQWIDINGILLPRPGHIFRIKKGARYGITREGSLVLVRVTPIIKKWLIEPGRWEVTIWRLDSKGKLVNKSEMEVLAQDLEPVENEEKIIEGWKNPEPPQDVLRDGEAVELAEEVVISQQTQRGVIVLTLPKGLKGIIDEPQLKQGLTLDEINFLRQREFEVEIETAILLLSGDREENFGRALFRAPVTIINDIYHVYVPYYRQYFEFSRSQLKRRNFDREMFDRVVMNVATYHKILSLVEWKDDILNKWGVDDTLRRGRGKIILAYGPPGSGKTLTGEALGERLCCPVYFADISDFGNSMESFEKGLKTLIEKTERWESVTLINEAELILESRREGNPFDASMRVAAVLRNLEKLQKGILWLTTNRPVIIDFAIESRISAQIYFPPFTKEQRRQVWKVNKPDKLPVPGFEERLDELAKIPIDGREISNVISNAATQASREGLEFVPVEYLFDWGNDIVGNRKVRKEAERDWAGREHGTIGFLSDEKD